MQPLSLYTHACTYAHTYVNLKEKRLTSSVLPCRTDIYSLEFYVHCVATSTKLYSIGSVGKDLLDQ